MYFDIPEYHDEGRLPAGNDASGPLLGPVAGIYASPFLYGFTRRGQIIDQGVPGILAAIVVVNKEAWETMPTTYTNLRLTNGMNCVWLFVMGGNYVAFVTHPDPGTPCDRKAGRPGGPPAKPDDGRLPVVAVQRSVGEESDYPAVARFDTDRNGNPILAFKCLDAFCEVGPSREADVRTPIGLTRQDPSRAKWRLPNPLATQYEARTRGIKGWHDEQALAIRDNQFRWRPSQVWATIIPVSGAASYDSASFHRTWQHVATVKIAGQVPVTSKYYDWGLRKGDNEVWFQFDGGAWNAEIRQGGVRTPLRYMKRTIHYDISVPPIVRFRWTGADDGIWAPCGNACCKAAGQ
jgi:hypothetical protein